MEKDNWIPIDVRNFKIVDQRGILHEARENRERVAHGLYDPMVRIGRSQGIRETNPRKSYKPRGKKTA